MVAYMVSDMVLDGMPPNASDIVFTCTRHGTRAVAIYNICDIGTIYGTIYVIPLVPYKRYQ